MVGSPRIRATVVAAVVVCLAAGSATANTVSIPLINPSFEEDPAPDGAGVPGAFGWSPPYTNPDPLFSLYTWNPNNVQFPGTTGSPGTLPSPADGTQYLTNVSTVANRDTLATQLTASTLQPHKIYTLTVAFGSPLDRIMDGFALGFVDATAGAEITEGDYSGYPPNVPLVGRDANGDLSPAPTGLWADVSFSINSDDYLGKNGYAAGDGIGVFIDLGAGACADNVRLTMTDVPEPSVFVLLATGFIGTAICVWRKQPEVANLIPTPLRGWAYPDRARAA